MSIPIESPVYRFDGWEGNVLDDEGVAWVVEGEDGWSSSPPVNPIAEPRTVGDGAWAGPGYYGARVMVLSGTAIASSRTSMLWAKERIKSAGSIRRLMPLVVAEAHLTRTALVRLSDTTAITDKSALAFGWSMQLTAADPRRYSVDAVSPSTQLPTSSTAGRTYPRTYPVVYGGAVSGGSGSVYVTNDGNYDETPALVTFRGPLIGPRVEHAQSGRSLSWDLTLGWDETLVVDLNPSVQSALLNGSSSRANTITSGSAWFTLQKGLNELRFRGTADVAPPDIVPAPVPSMTVRFASAWT